MSFRIERGFHLPRHSFDVRAANRAALRALIAALFVALLATWITLGPALIGAARGAELGAEHDHRYSRAVAPGERMQRRPRVSVRVSRGRYSHLVDVNGNRLNEDCLPASIRAAVDRVRAACGPVAVLSTLRPGARIPGGGVSLHAACQAVDFRPRSYACAYRVLADWPYGLSVDGPRVAHIHLSAPGLRNEGRFRHGVRYVRRSGGRSVLARQRRVTR